MNEKSKLRIIIINVLLFALLFGLTSLNKSFLRPNFNHIPFGVFLTGSLPNFLAAFLISLSVVNPILVKNPKYSRYIVYIASFLIFVILTFEEIMPMWGASTQFDSYDIIASGLGSVLAILTFEQIVSARKNKVKKVEL